MDEVSPLLEPLERGNDTINCLRKNFWLLFILLIWITIWIISTITVDEPKIYIQQIYIPTLDQSENYSAATVNPSLFFDLKFENSMKDHSLSYGNTNITFFYVSNYITRRLSVANSPG